MVRGETRAKSSAKPERRAKAKLGRGVKATDRAGGVCSHDPGFLRTVARSIRTMLCARCACWHCIRVILLPALAVYLRLHSRGPRSRTLKSGPLALLNPFLIPSLAAVAGMTGNGAAEAVCLSFSALPERDAGSMKSRDRIKGAQGRVGRRPNDDNSPVSHARCAKLRWPCGPFGARWRAAGRAGSATGDNLHFASTTYKDDDEGHH